ncbi:hypothetical protein Bca52824_020455 [Brassica carinata]|uniref:RING-type domain-containing protein n=1 Tax=Brassica carinata TaxID=52824 RepID=A0A8X8B0M0_BRACI|nr:hypothetical protein Bca52824_020455 [Brassica carinata]
MGQQQSKGKLLYQQVSYRNSEDIRALHREGADLEVQWMDRKGKTPLIMACMNSELYDVAKTLIELGANVNAYRPGRHAGTPMHHAAKRGLWKTVKLLLSHGANPLVLNDDCQTPLEVARDKGFGYAVHAIERHICLFSGYMRRFDGPTGLGSDSVWVVVIPTGSRNPVEPLKLEVAVYDHQRDDLPRTVMPLWKANFVPITSQDSGISVMITVDDSTIPSRWRESRKRRHRVFKLFFSFITKTHLRLAPSTEGGEQQLKWFCDACKGIPQPTHPPNLLQTPPSAPPLHPAMSDTPNTNHLSIGEASYSTAPPPPPSLGLNSHEGVIVHEPSPSAPPLKDDDDLQTLEEGPVHYPTIDSTPVDVPSLSSLPASAEGEKKEDGSSGQCSICLDAPSDAVCVPCGHVSGCMSCLTEIKSMNYGCPVCRAKIDQIVRLYRV